MRKGGWTQTVVFDALKLAGALALFGSPWLFQLPPGAKWNLWICGYFVVVASLAALLAEADWEPEVNLCIGAWLLIAPWVLGFSHDLAASLLHLLGGSLVSILSALTWYADRSPPWQFRPGAALRAQSFAGLSVRSRERFAVTWRRSGRACNPAIREAATHQKSAPNKVAAHFRLRVATRVSISNPQWRRARDIPSEGVVSREHRDLEEPR
jgi:hypothetical protein